MRINIVSGLTNRAADLARLWTDYRDLWTQRDARPESTPDPTPSVPEQRKQALVHPRRAPTWMLGVLRRMQDASRNRVNTDEHSGSPGPFVSARREQQEVEPIPSGAPGDGQILTAKPAERRIPEVPADRQSFKANANSSVELASVSDQSARDQAVRARKNFMLILERTMKQAPSVRL